MQRSQAGPLCLYIVCIAAAAVTGCSEPWRGSGGPDSPACPPGAKCDSPGQAAAPLAGEVGHCVPFVPYSGYRTCLMDAPQMPDGPAAPGPLVQPRDGLPAAVDHREAYLKGCIEVHSQGSCGWCTAHATTAALEALVCKGQHTPRRISEPHLWWLGKERGSFTQCEGGWYISSAFSNLGTMTDHGFLLVRGALWPYSDDLAQMNRLKPADSVLYKQGEHGAHSSQIGAVSKKSATALKQALAAGYDVVYSVPTFHGVGWKWWDPTYGHITAPNPAPPGLCTCDDCASEPHCLSGYHAVLITGYDDKQQAFQLLNSWGSTWGQGGFGTIDYATIDSYGQGGRYAKQLKLTPQLVTTPDLGLPDIGADSSAPDAGLAEAGATPDGGSADGGAGDLSADLTLPAPGDGATCAAPAPLPLTGQSVTVQGSTVGVANQFGLSVTCGSGMTYDGSQRYYRVTLAAGKTYKAVVTPSGFDVALYAFPAQAGCSALAVSQGCQGRLADKWGGASAEQLTLATKQGGDWLLVVDSFDPAAAGAYSLTVSW